MTDTFTENFNRKNGWNKYRLTENAIEAFESGGGYEYLPRNVKEYCKGIVEMRHFEPESVLMIGFAPDGTEFALIKSDLMELPCLDEDLFTI